MASKVRRLGIVVALAIVLLIGVVQLALSFSEVGVISEIGTGGLPLTADDLSAIPQSVAEDATRLAMVLFEDCEEDCDEFVNQLLAVYLEAKDRDFVIVFNSGGWGWNLLETTAGWQSIFTGIESELNSSGYTSLLLDYRRTAESLPGRFDELVEMITGYPSKVKDLAARVEFFTKHIPDLRVILTGESTGTVITDSVMSILEDNPQVYSIQTGPPSWHTNIVTDRTLVLRSNGIIPDSYSQGDFWAVVWGNLRYRFHLSQPVGDFGTTPHYIAAPGHDYWWQYPEVYSQITDFLRQNFGIE